MIQPHITLEPILPMEPKSGAVIPCGDEWLAQVKWDGVRILTYHNNLGTRLFNRRKNARTLNYPELTAVKSYLKARSAILDGEVIALGQDGKPSFHEVMRRDGLRRAEALPALQKEVPIYYLIFDLLYYNGRWLIEESLEARLAMLDRIIIPGSHVSIVDSHSDGELLFQAVRRQEMEGVVMKRKDSLYRPGQKCDHWRKIKVFQDLVAVVGGFTRDGFMMNSLLLGLYEDSGSLIFVGQTGSGKLTQSEWSGLAEILKPLTTLECPFADQSAIKKGAVWVRPLLSAKVNFVQWSSGGLMRQPVLQAVIDYSSDDDRIFV